MTELGLRERKKRQTRQAIFETAARLFAERGFDAVTVAEIARAVDVSEVTVFNYFATKEELFFGGMTAFEEQLVEAVRSRPSGESALAAFRRPIVDGFARLADEDAGAVIAKAAAVINASSALQAREREVVARYTGLLAGTLAGDAGTAADAVEPWTVASALMGTHRALVAHVRNRALAGLRGRRLAADARAQAIRGFVRLERGIGDYAIQTE
jgi:AcrR family transcriptional regulator